MANIRLVVIIGKTIELWSRCVYILEKFLCQIKKNEIGIRKL